MITVTIDRRTVATHGWRGEVVVVKAKHGPFCVINEYGPEEFDQAPDSCTAATVAELTKAVGL